MVGNERKKVLTEDNGALIHCIRNAAALLQERGRRILDEASESAALAVPGAEKGRSVTA